MPRVYANCRGKLRPVRATIVFRLASTAVVSGSNRLWTQTFLTLLVLSTPCTGAGVGPTATPPVITAVAAADETNRPYPKAISIILEDAQRVLTSLGLIATSVWAYFNYFRGRTYKPRLEPKVSVNLVQDGAARSLLVRVSLKNVGLSKVGIRQAGTALSLDTARLPSEYSADVKALKFSGIAVLTIFNTHGWIEPNELIEEQHLVTIPGPDTTAVRVQLRVVSEQRKSKEWNAQTIVLSGPANTPVMGASGLDEGI